VKNINFVLLGDASFAEELGKKGTTTDISIYDKKTPDAILTWTVPITYPDKIQSLIQAINIAEYAILNVTKLDKFVGEQIIALDHLSMSQGYILHSYDVDQDRLKSMIKTTEIKNYDFLADSDELRVKMSNLQPKSKEGSLVIPIDHSFDVKGVGTVILGVIKQGKVSVHDELTILPQGKKVFVKSIQMHDDSADEATSPARVGLALKGISAIDISRGDVICNPGYLSTSTLAKAKFKKNPYFKEEMGETHTYLLAVGLQLKPVKIRFLEDEIELELLKPLVFSPDQHFVVIKPDASGVRVCGKGEII
jgi:selenocysteine-specific translation elongation factor